MSLASRLSSLVSRISRLLLPASRLSPLASRLATLASRLSSVTYCSHLFHLVSPPSPSASRLSYLPLTLPSHSSL